MDFLNTLYSPAEAPVETIGDGGRFIDWLIAAHLIDAAAGSKYRRQFGDDALDAAAAEARKLRKWAADWIVRWSASPRADYSVELRRMNALMERASYYREAVPIDDGVQMVERNRIESAGQLIVPVATQLAALVADESPELIKQCAGSACTLLFVDRTKAHARRYCSAAACGNRAKVAAFRERNRAG